VCPTSTCDTNGRWQQWTLPPDAPNVVWGSTCGGADCQGPWTTDAGGGAVFGASDGDTVVWGSSGDDGDTVVWGSSCTDPSCRPVIWNRP
jgi:hypothetical protein